MTGDPTDAGAELVTALADAGVRRMYAVPGESYLEVLDAAGRDPRIRLVSTRHESGAAFMAEADAKLSGLPAVAAGTRAPGATNLAIGVHTALHDSTPLVALLGQVPRDLLGVDGAFQGIDLEAFYRPITKWRATLDSPLAARRLGLEAFAAATSGRPGPVALVLPSDVLGASLSPGDVGDHVAAQPEPVLLPTPARAGLEELARHLSEARSPVILAGGRALEARAELIELAERLGAGVYCSFRRQDRFPNDHPAYLGHLTLSTPQEVLEPLRRADVVLALGCRMSEVTTQSFTLPGPQSWLARLDTFASEPGPGPAPALELTAGSVRDTLGELLGALADRPIGAGGRADLSSAHARYLALSTPPPARSAGRVDPSEVVAAMVATLPEDAVVANDAGNFSIFLHRYWRYRHASSQLAPTSGAMGYAVPAAVAAGIVAPHRLAVAVAGDGGYLMTGNEIETAVRLGVKLVAIVFRNGLYGTIAAHQARSFGRLSGVEIGEVDLAAHARSLGATGLSVRERDELSDALAQACEADGPAVVDVALDPDVLGPGASLAALTAAPRRLAQAAGGRARSH